MKRDDSTLLLDMLLAARDAVAFAKGRSRDDLERDRQLALSLAKAVEIVGEAASRVGKETRDAHPELPWTQIVAMRNRLVHGYFAIRLDVLWQTVQDDLPALIALLEPLVPPQEDA